MAAGDEWAPPPMQPTLGKDEVSVWRLASAEPRPIETVLARHLAVEPSSLTLRRTPLGKPELAGAPFRFSLAHSGEVALVAITEARDIGVDVECVRAGPERWSLVNHALTSRECRRLECIPRAQRADAFLSVWTRKEALLKAAGVGLIVDPALVELDDDSVVALPSDLGPIRDWTLLDIPLPGHAGAVAVRGKISKLRLYEADPVGDARSEIPGGDP